MQNLGRKIQQSCEDLASKALQISNKGTHFFQQNQYSYQKNVHENLLFLFGEYLISMDESIKDDFIKFANIYGQQTISNGSSMDESINFIYTSRFVLIEFLENEITNKTISVEILFKVIKIVEPIFQLISNTIMSHHHDNLSTTKFALDESNKDLKTTLKELSDLRNALNQATIFSISDNNDKMVYVNDNFCTLYKYGKEELIGNSHWMLFSDCHTKEFFDEIWQTIQRGEVWTGEILNKAKDGTIYCVDTTMVPFIDQNGKTYQHISIQYDVTEKKKAEEMLLKTEKLSMVGELAAGIAHEIRNPLTTIKGFVQLLAESEKGKNYSNTILEEIERINFIVNEFMVFAKPHTTYFSRCNIIEIIKSVLKFLEPEALLKNVIIETNFSSSDLWISGEKNQLRQVFLNILKNAIEATMPYGGTVKIYVERLNNEIVISIEDNGSGMTEEQVKKIGEPFYTTKETGNGLGLMVSYKIIHNHKGIIQVESIPDIGTKFVLSFPSYENQ
ncbi:ATP-binding protein [Neobacillus pocheonensis]|uniref:ATP-binding protein n=1 Tax=Neobacillus pocheonensis TaxID=363869 RepID=UPI003D28974C